MAIATMESNESSDAEADPTCKTSKDDPNTAERMSNKYTMLQAVGFNTMNMFGTGPLITIPYCLSSVDPKGPQAMLGYIIACVACSCDSLVWGEIGSMWPISGGSCIYLKELYGRETWGRLASFMYIWQFFISGPAEIASGFVAIAEYMVYFSPDVLDYGYRVMISVGSLLFCALLLFRKVDDVGRITIVLWVVTIFAILFTLIAGFSDWTISNMEVPKNAFRSGSGVIAATAAATRFGVYDMTGYYDVCFMGGEVRNPRRTIPISCISTCIIVGFIYILVYLAVLGHLPWQSFIGMYDDDYDGNAPGIMSLFTESRIGKEFAYVVTIVVAMTIFGSTYSMLCGFGYLPYAAAKDGTFFQFFAHESQSCPGLADRSLLVVVLLTIPWCFFSLEVVIDAMTTMLVLVQFIGQAVGLLYYRWRVPKEEQPSGWHMPLFPLPCIVQIIIFSFIWISSDSSLLWGSDQPILELSVGFLCLGPVFFLLRSRWRQEWPFAKSEILSTTTIPARGDVHAATSKNQGEVSPTEDTSTTGGQNISNSSEDKPGTSSI